MGAKEYLRGIYLDSHEFSKSETIKLMEDYHLYMKKQDISPLKLKEMKCSEIIELYRFHKEKLLSLDEELKKRDKSIGTRSK